MQQANKQIFPAVIKPGVAYLLSGNQRLQFQETAGTAELKMGEGGMTLGAAGPDVLVTDGTTTTELLEVLVDRLQAQNKHLPCRETSMVITKLQEASMWLAERTRRIPELKQQQQRPLGAVGFATGGIVATKPQCTEASAPRH